MSATSQIELPHDKHNTEERGISRMSQEEPPVRIELTTYRLQGGCSTTELQGR
jgi:hypothetical protein